MRQRALSGKAAATTHLILAAQPTRLAAFKSGKANLFQNGTAKNNKAAD